MVENGVGKIGMVMMVPTVVLAIQSVVVMVL